MIVVFAVLCLAAAFAFGLRAAGVLGSSQSAAQLRLHEMLAEPEPEEGRDVEFAVPGTEGLAGRLTPNRIVARLERNLVLAGYPDGWGLARLLSVKLIACGAGLAVGLSFASSGFSAINLLVLVAAPALGYFAPDTFLSGRAKRRQQEIQRALPDMLDQISVSLDSGMSFESSLSRIGQMMTGPLADEIVRTVQDIALGVPRRTAYEAMVARTDIKEMRLFVRAIIQGEEFGVAVADVVRDQSEQMREARRMRAEAKANEVPVKMLIPLVLCILPTLFMVILGPAIINAIAAFKNF